MLKRLSTVVRIIPTVRLRYPISSGRKIDENQSEGIVSRERNRGFRNQKADKTTYNAKIKLSDTGQITFVSFVNAPKSKESRE